ncbi:MAG: 3-hydroxyacyl-ACP dehydratase FabZ family protein [Thermoanaerobaculia bacterium]
MRFLLVDRIEELASGRRARGVKNVTLSEDFFTHHFPSTPVMPGALIAESLVQLAGWMIREESAFQRLGLAESFDRIKFHRLVHPGDQLALAVEWLEADAERVRFQGEASCRDRRVAEARFTLRLWPAGPFEDAEQARRSFVVLTDPERRLGRLG